MSVQVKKKFEELVAYLGKDTKGLEKVKQLKDAVNELRKKLAAAEERLSQMEAVKNAARERADKAEAEKLEAVKQQQQAIAAQANYYYDAQELQRKEEEWIALNNTTRRRLFETVSGTRAVDPLDYEAVFSRLRERMPDCVAPSTKIYLYDISVPVFDRFALADGFTDDDIWQLGAVIAMVASATGLVCISTAKHGLSFKNTSAATERVTAIAAEASAWLRRNDVIRDPLVVTATGASSEESLANAAAAVRQQPSRRS